MTLEIILLTVAYLAGCIVMAWMEKKLNGEATYLGVMISWAGVGALLGTYLIDWYNKK